MNKAILTGLAAIAAAAGLSCAKEALVYNQRDLIEQEGSSEFIYHDITWDREYLELAVRVIENGELKQEIEWTRYEPADSAECLREIIHVYSERRGEDYTVIDEKCDFHRGHETNADSATGYSEMWGNLDGESEDIILPEGDTIKRATVVNYLFSRNKLGIIEPRFNNVYEILANYHRWKELE